MQTILLVDDEPDFLATAKYILEQTYKVVLATDGDEALQKMLEETPDLVVTDLAMPNVNGFEFIRHMASMYPGIPIIAISGQPDARAMLKDARILGVKETLQKPFTGEQLLNAISTTLAVFSKV